MPIEPTEPPSLPDPLAVPCEEPLIFDPSLNQVCGPAGTLTVHPDDEVARKILMLVLGECTNLGPNDAARLFGFSRQRYYQLLQGYQREGSGALSSSVPGPKPGVRSPHEPLRQFLRRPIEIHILFKPIKGDFHCVKIGGSIQGFTK